MNSLFLALFALLMGFAVHLLVWRIRLPKSQLSALAAVFFLTWCVAAAAICVSGVSALFLGGDSELAGFLYFSLIFWSAALCYMITYSAMEGDSPTLSLTRHLHRKGEEGVSHDEIEEFFRQRPFVGARVKALVTDNVFVEEEGGYRLSPGSYLFFRVILGYRRVVFGSIKSGG